MTTMTLNEIDSLKIKLKAIWMDGNYDLFSRYMERPSAEFYHRIGAKPGQALLDVACGSGQLALIAARAGVRVTGIDIATNSIAAARGRAAAERLDASFDEGDAEALPYADATFDVVATIYGAMFAPRPELVAAEMARVARPGGTVAMANWTKDGFVGQMFKTFGTFVPPPAMPSPVLWGDEQIVAARFDGRLSSLSFSREQCRFDYPFPPAEVVEFFRKYYGPAARAFAALDEGTGAALRSALTTLWSDHNQSTDPNRTIVDGEYLQVLGVRA